MMTTVGSTEAKTHLDELIRAALDGEEVVIMTQRGEQCRLAPMESPIPPKGSRGFGALRGKISLTPDFDKPLDDFKDYM